MPSRLNHVKIVTAEPEVVNAFLTEVCDIPAGWPLGDAKPLPEGAPLGPGGELTMDDLDQRRQITGGGFIAGSPDSRQFQIFQGDPAGAWAVCVSTRYVEDVHERARQRGVPCTPLTVTDWNERDNIRFFFCTVAGVVFEVIRVEPKSS
jgi:hypothetical protein